MRGDWARFIKPELKETIPEQLEVSVGPDIRRALYGAPRGSPTPSKRSDMMVSRPKIARIMPRSRSIKLPEIKQAIDLSEKRIQCCTPFTDFRHPCTGPSEFPFGEPGFRIDTKKICIPYQYGRHH